MPVVDVDSTLFAALADFKTKRDAALALMAEHDVDPDTEFAATAAELAAYSVAQAIPARTQRELLAKIDLMEKLYPLADTASHDIPAAEWRHLVADVRRVSGLDRHNYQAHGDGRAYAHKAGDEDAETSSPP